MNRKPRRRLIAAMVGTAALVAGAAIALIAPITSANAATSLACDIYAAGGTPCISAHSTTRALFAAYNGPLYQVQRTSDKATTDVGLLAAGGYANAAIQDTFIEGLIGLDGVKEFPLYLCGAGVPVPRRRRTS